MGNIERAPETVSLLFGKGGVAGGGNLLSLECTQERITGNELRTLLSSLHPLQIILLKYIYTHANSPISFQELRSSYKLKITERTLRTRVYELVDKNLIVSVNSYHIFLWPNEHIKEEVIRTLLEFDPTIHHGKH